MGVKLFEQSPLSGKEMQPNLFAFGSVAILDNDTGTNRTLDLTACYISLKKFLNIQTKERRVFYSSKRGHGLRGGRHPLRVPSRFRFMTLGSFLGNVWHCKSLKTLWAANAVNDFLATTNTH